MDIDKKLVKKIATLSKLKIKEKEVEIISKDLSKIITWVEKLNEVDTKDVTPVSNPSDIKIPFREDEINDFNSIKKTFTSKIYEDRTYSKTQTSVPIFILGFSLGWGSLSILCTISFIYIEYYTLF